jgi:hypothetical protein
MPTEIKAHTSQGEDYVGHSVDGPHFTFTGFHRLDDIGEHAALSIHQLTDVSTRFGVYLSDGDPYVKLSLASDGLSGKVRHEITLWGITRDQLLIALAGGEHRDI